MSNGNKTQAEQFDELFFNNGEQPAQTPPVTEASTAPQGDGEGEPAPVTPPTGGAQAEVPAGTGEAAAPAAAADDWINELPEAARNRVLQERRAAQERFDALHGKVAPTQRALAEANSQLANLRRNTAPAGQQQPASTAPVGTDSYFDSDEWKQYAESYPGDAKVMRKALEHNRSADAARIAQLEQQVREQGATLANASRVAYDVELGRNVDELTKRHPDWQAVNKSTEFWDWFDDYRAGMPAEVRDAYYNEANLDRWFNDAKFTGDVIGLFKRETGYAAPQDAQGANPHGAESTQPPAPVTPPAQSAKARMAVAPDVRTNAGAPQRTVPFESMTPKEQFDALWGQTRQS